MLGALVLVAGLGARADTPAPDARSAYAAAFQETLLHPSDPAVVLRYAEQAARANDLEGAVSALERLLLLNGDQPRVKFELGVLYYRLGSYEAARAYFEEARASTLATEEVRQKSGRYLTEIADRTGRSRFTGELLAGLRYSTNANGGPTGSVLSAGTSTIADPAFAQRSDFSAVSAANLHHRYDAGRQDGIALESNLGLYASRQFQVSEADVLVVEGNSGPRLQPFGGWAERVSVRPFFMGRYVAVHDSTSYWAWGGGVEAAAALAHDLHFATTLYSRRREFANSVDAPFNDSSSGQETGGFSSLRWEATPNVALSLGLNALRYSAVTGWESYWEYGGGAAVVLQFTDPLGFNGRPWQITANAYVQRDDYDQSNPFVDPATVRGQVDVGLGLALGVPLDERLSLTAQAGYAQRAATINNYSYSAFTALVGVGWRF